MVKTTGMVEVAAFAARAVGVPALAKMTATLRLTQIGGQRRQPVVVTVRKAVFERDVSAFDKARFVEAAPIRGQQVGELRG
jgi:hypothetical protein